jgi:hypothetical protein
VPHEQIRNSPGLRDVADILFGDDAERRLTEYLLVSGGTDASVAPER